MSDSVSEFISSLETDENVAKSVESVLNGDSEEVQSLAGDRQLGTAKKACLVSKLVLGENAFLSNASIQPLVERSWTQTCWLSPSCVLRPKTTKQVSQILKISTFLRTTFSIRSGGHSPNPGWASTEDGLLIDLGSLNQTSISEDRGTASVGSGAKWNDVVNYLDPFDVTVLAGRQPSVGVGGLILGGGVSHFTPEYGLAADTLKNVEVVLADGKIVNANAKQNADLFWALKGGGSNFGIATRFDLKTVPIKNIWFESNVYAPDQAHALIEAFAEYQEIDDPKASVIFSLSPTFGTVGLIYSAPVERPAAFAPFYSVPVMQAALPGTLGTVSQLNNIIASLASPITQRHDYRGASSQVDAQLYKDVYDFWVAKASEVGEQTGANATFVLQHIPKSTVDIGYANGGNALGLSRETQQWWTSIMDWNDQSDDDLVRSIGIETTAKWKELSEQRGLDNPFLYMNDASRDQDPLGSYPPGNIDRLKSIARKYDPQGVFQRLQDDGFLLKDVP